MAEDEMTLNERRKYLKKMWPRYAQADKKERNTLLTEMEAVTGMHCKTASCSQRVVRPHVGLLQPLPTILHLSGKQYLQEVGRTRRRWDVARTPFERLRQAGALLIEQEERLDVLYMQTNPRQLRTEIYR